MPPDGFPFLFEDLATAEDVVNALRLYEGRLRPLGRQLSPGAEAVREAAERSLRVRAAQPLPSVSSDSQDRVVAAELCTYEEVATHLRVSTSTVKRLVRAGDLATVRVLGAPRVHTDDLAAYVATLREESA